MRKVRESDSFFTDTPLRILRVAIGVVNTHLYLWKTGLTDAVNEDNILTKKVNLKKKYFFELAHGAPESKTTPADNQVKRKRERDDAAAVRDGTASAEQSTRFGVTRANHQCLGCYYT